MAAWDRQEGETSKAHAAFARYLSIGPSRSILRACQEWCAEVGKKYSASVLNVWSRWSRKWRWVERATAKDDQDVSDMLDRASAMRDSIHAVFLSRVRDVAERMIGIALGEVEADSVQLRACQDVLDRAGCIAPRMDEGGGISILLPSPEELAEQVAERSAGER